MQVQTRLIPLALAFIFVCGCSSDDSSTTTSKQPATTTPAADAAAEPGAAATAAELEDQAPSSKDDSEDAAPATAAYLDSSSVAGMSAAGQDQPLEVCWSEAASADAASYKISGSIEVVSGPGNDTEVSQLVLIATDAPLGEWKTGGTVPVYGVGVATLGGFRLDIEAAPAALYVCAFAPPTFHDNQAFLVAGCTAEPITGKAGVSRTVTDVKLMVAPRSNPVATLGGARFGKQIWMGARVRRTVSGKVTGVTAESFVIATAPTAILEEESDSEPLGMAVAGADGIFSLSYFAAPREPLFVCAMAFDDAKALSSLAGMSCTRVELPEAGPAATNEFKDIEVVVSGEAEEMDEDDKAQIALLQRCFAAK